jgi:hypothetical protein
MGVGQQRKPGHPSTTTCITVNITVPTSAQIGATLERVARIIAVLVAATMAAGFVVSQTLTGLATIARNLTRRPLRTLIDLVPAVPAKPNYPHYLPEVPILTGAELMALWGAEFVDEPAPVRPVARRKPAKATKVAVGV